MDAAARPGPTLSLLSPLRHSPGSCRFGATCSQECQKRQFCPTKEPFLRPLQGRPCPGHKGHRDGSGEHSASCPKQPQVRGQRLGQATEQHREGSDHEDRVLSGPLAPRAYGPGKPRWLLQHSNAWHEGPKLTVSHGSHVPMWNVSQPRMRLPWQDQLLKL